MMVEIISFRKDRIFFYMKKLIALCQPAFSLQSGQGWRWDFQFLFLMTVAALKNSSLLSYREFRFAGLAFHDFYNIVVF